MTSRDDMAGLVDLTLAGWKPDMAEMKIVCDMIDRGGNVETARVILALEEQVRRLQSLTSRSMEAGEGWRTIDSAPKDGTIIDVWLGEEVEDGDHGFYCSPGTRRATSWHWKGGKFRPYTGLMNMPVAIAPTHWMPLPSPPALSPPVKGKE